MSDNELYGNSDEFTVGSDFTVGDTIPGVGTFYSINVVLQNGAPDELALSFFSDDTVQTDLQFISYEGVMGPAGAPGSAMGLGAIPSSTAAIQLVRHSP